MSAVMLFLLFHKMSFSYNLFIVLFTFVGYFLIGLIDDLLIIKKGNNKGLSENNKLVIKISNSTDGCINEFNGRFISTKGGMMHGIGLTQVDGVVKKYNGYINRRHEKNIFTTYVMIQY